MDRHWCALLAALCAATLLVGCDTSVQAFQPSDEYHYSVYGILAPSRDTQWVRVESLAEQTTVGATDELDVTVTLENVDTGQRWTLQDSLVEVFRDEFQHNFWTTAPIVPAATYQLTVQGPDDKQARATTTTPAVPPSIEIEAPIRLPCRPPYEAEVFAAEVTEVEELAGLRVQYYQSLVGPTEVYEYDHYDEAVRTNNAYRAEINYYRDLQSAQQRRGRPCPLDSAHAIAAAGGPDWPEWARFSEASLETVARPDSFTNVEGGHGLVAGVALDTVTVPISREE